MIKIHYFFFFKSFNQGDSISKLMVEIKSKMFTITIHCSTYISVIQQYNCNKFIEHKQP